MVNNSNLNKNISENLLPRFYRSEANKKFLQSTIEQLIQPGSVERVNGFIGRQNSKATKSSDIFIDAKTKDRQNYQLEPAVVIKNNLDYVSFFKDYQDYINQLNIFNGNTKNHSRLNQQEFYAWNPHIDWDKFVNFQNYYWCPTGPLPISISNQTDILSSIFSVTIKIENNNNVYLFSEKSYLENFSNPEIVLYKGQTYQFNISSTGNPFSIKTSNSIGDIDRYEEGVTGHAVENGTITFKVSNTTPNTLYYQSEIDPNLGGVFVIKDPVEFTTLDVERDFLGKKNISIKDSNTEFKLSNGMKIKFSDTVMPESYRNNVYYLEGIGDSIKLILEDDLSIHNVNFINLDTQQIDTTYITYVVINRSSPAHSLWSRFNKWIHKDVLINSAAFNKETVELEYKSTRPIIEFDGELVLYNYGTEFIGDIDLIDTTTGSIGLINGQADYIIDQESLTALLAKKPNDQQYLTVLFTGLTDLLRNNCIFTITKTDNVLNVNDVTRIIPISYQTVIIKYGYQYSNKAFWYTDNNIWQFSQQKNIVTSENLTDQNQAPLFDIFNLVDNKVVSYSNAEYFQGSTFVGTKLFSYKINDNGILDTKLNLKLSYKNIENSGDIVFSFDYDKDIFSYKSISGNIIEKFISTGYLKKVSWNKITLVNGWEKSTFLDTQPAIKIYKNTNIITSEEDRTASDYIHGKVYFSGNIVRYYDGNLYQVKVDGTVSSSGTIESPPEFVNVNVINYIGDNTTKVTVTIDNTFRYFEDDVITISNSSIASLNGKWIISSVTSKNTFTFISNSSLPTGVYNTDLGNVIKSKNTQSWDFYDKSLLKLNNFQLDIFDNKNELTDLTLKVYINDVITDRWVLLDGVKYKEVILFDSIKYEDVLTLKAYSKQPINNNGYYQIPINLQYNPLNLSIDDITFGEVLDHTKSIIDNLTNTSLITELRDLGNVAAYGTKFVQHTGPLSLSLYHITSETNNVIKAIEQSREDYNKFKRSFITVAENLGIDAEPIVHVNLILQELNKNKSSSSPYYFSDMVPYGAYKKTDFIVVDFRSKSYPLTYNASLPNFSLDTLSNRAICVYHNNTQLIYGKEYTFDSSQGFVIINIDLQNDDVISVYEYDTTDGSCIPETPTKLGLWPKYEPKKYLDTTLITPKYVIQGHDGSIILAYNDYRDNLILELETRIYNNIKSKYDPSIFDINDIIPRHNINTAYSLDEFNNILAPSFYKWSNLVGKDFSKPLSFDVNNQLTFNYCDYMLFDNQSVPGYWRGIYQWLFGTDRPHLCPWEMLGFSEEPMWWKEVYGLPPYTDDNLKMWSDISLGIIREPNTPITQNSKYIRKFLLEHIPVDAEGNLLGPLSCNIVYSSGMLTENTNFIFGDIAPIEAAWRRSSHYSFSVIIATMLMFPAKTFGLLFDKSRIVKNYIGQIVYKDIESFIQPNSILLPNTVTNTTQIQTAGIVNYLINYIISDKLKSLDSYINDLSIMQCQLSYRVGGFTSKEKFNLLLDSKSPLATGNIFVPKEDYDIFLNTSSPIKQLTYSGVIISKLYDGFEINGYIKSQPYFNCYIGIGNGKSINVGGISETYVVWSTNQNYNTGKIVEYNNKFYRSIFDHNSGTIFNNEYYLLLPNLPVIGGRDANFKTIWDKSQVIAIPYGTKFVTIQEVVDFLLGYGEWLKDQGFVFDDFNTNINQVLNWETSAKEFLFWTTQNWSTGEDKWNDWEANVAVSYNSIVKYNGEYYRAIRNVPADHVIYPDQSYIFVIDDKEIQEVYYEKLDELSTVGSSVISLSPSASKITINVKLSVVDDVRNQFYDYEIFSVNGEPIFINQLSFYRENNLFTCSAVNNIGIYAAKFYLVQKEQVVVLNNVTIFNDLIYNSATGYKQDRIKVSGYVSTNWDGGFNIPGFIFDQAIIQEWALWTDYALGDMVKYKEFYYSANSFIPGSETFDEKKWHRLDEIPTSKLIPNWSYKALQFTDFHSLDSDNFDSDQQKMAQHLVGYQKRQYLDNIVKDDVSEFKFYQGMILEKGTQNVFNKLFDVLNRSENESLEFYEEWALRLGRYGASSAYDVIEVVLDESQFKNNPQGFELVKTIDNSTIDFIIRSQLQDLYVPPTNTINWPDIWPTFEKYKPFLRSAGSVDENDVQLILRNIEDIRNQDINIFVNGDYIWCTFDTIIWNVYKFVVTNNNILSITYIAASLDWEVKFRSPVQIDVGSYIGLKNLVNGGDGFYQVVAVDKFSIRIIAKSGTFEFDEQDQISAIYIEVIGQHIKYFDDLTDNKIGYKIFTKDLSSKDLLWTGGFSNIPFASWIYNPVFSPKIIRNSFPRKNLEYGREIAISKNGVIVEISLENFDTIYTLAISTSLGEIFVYDGFKKNNYWFQKSLIRKPIIYISGQDTLLSSDYAKTLAISDDSKWLASGAPLAKNVIVKSYQGLNIAIDSEDVEIYGQNLSSIDLKNIGYDAYRYDADNVFYDNESSAYDFSVSNSTGMVSLYRKNSNDIFELVYTILSPLAKDDQYNDNDEKFGSSIIFAGNSLIVSAPDFKNKTVGSKNTGRVYILKNIDGSWKYDDTIDGDALWYNNNEYSFGYGLAVNYSGNKLAIASQSANTGRVTLYELNELSKYQETNYVVSPNKEYNFGRSISFSLLDEYLAISSINAETIDKKGIVHIYDYNGSNYVKVQSITSVFSSNIVSTNENDLSLGYTKDFGSKIGFIRNYNSTTDNNNSLVIFNDLGFIGYDSLPYDIPLYDDELGYYSYMGQRLFNIYDNYFEKWVLSESIIDINSNSYSPESGYGFVINQDSIFIGLPKALVSQINSGVVYEYKNRTANKDFSWTLRSVESKTIDSFKIKRAYLYNKRTNNLISYLDVVDCLLGKIPGVADQEIKYKTFYDPAVYSDISNLANRSDLSEISYSKTIDDVSINVDNGLAWTKEYVGSIWWDLRSARFVDIHTKTGDKQKDITYKNSMQNTLVVGASIDIYEWVESKYKPSEWDNLAVTEEGLSQGISGKSLYGDAAYSISRRYDSISRSYKNSYYYWVKNKTTIPNVVGRKLSADSISKLISNPRGQGYQYLTITGTNSFSLVNVENSLLSSDVVLTIEYWVTDKIDQNIHAQWKLVSNETNTQIPTSIEQKWFDSLCGQDKSGLTIPNQSLPVKLRYGIENRPLQSMFINRFEALKQAIEYANRILKQHHISELRDLSNIEKFDQAPSQYSMKYDISVDSYDELLEVNTSNIETAILTPIIVNGKITKINITNPGRGYVGQNIFKDKYGVAIGWYGPAVTVIGVGRNASIISVINDQGSLISKDSQNNDIDLVIDSGEGYLDVNTSVNVRSFSVLVNQNNNTGWSIYSYDFDNNSWIKLNSQTYNIKDYWGYVDWYAQGYDQYNIVNYAVDTFIELSLLNAKIGEIIKVRSDGAGNWVLLEKYADSNSIDWTTQYKVVASQNGTIQFYSTLYDYAPAVGYDSDLYDSVPYDSIVAVEIRYILESLRDDILIDDLRVEYLNLFFTSLRYALSEQHYLDWAFKTSLIKAKHNVGEFNTRVTYRNDNLDSFEEYVAEVKPYRTKIREYISCYNQIEENRLLTTDFDLQPIYENQKTTVIDTTIVNNAVVSDNLAILTYPWKSWYDNCIPNIVDFIIENPGYGYNESDIQINIIGECVKTAIAKPVLDDGRIVSVRILDPGHGYFFVPSVIVTGVCLDEAKLRAVVGSPVRSATVKIKFDRITPANTIDNIIQVEEYIGDGFNSSFILQWAPSNKRGESKVSIRLNEEIQEIPYIAYELKTIKDDIGTYRGSITFKDFETGILTPPQPDSIIRIEYYRDQNLLNAADRIKHYYNTSSGEPGKEFSQLMTGIDYGGVIISGYNLSEINDEEYDTKIDGGNLEYTTAKGIEITDIIVDGDDLISQNNSSSLEEVVPGHISDSVAIKIFDNPRVNTNLISANIAVDSYVTDGIINSFRLSQRTNSQNAIVVKTSTFIRSIKLSKIEKSITIGDIFETGVKQGQVINIEDNIITYKLLSDQNFSVNEIIFVDQFSIGTIIDVNSYVAFNICEIDTDFIFNFDENKIEFKSTLPINTTVSIFSIGFNGGIFDIDYIRSSGFESIITTKYAYSIISYRKPIVYVDGYLQTDSDITFFENEDSSLGINFNLVPSFNSLITVLLVENTSSEFSITKKQSFFGNGTNTYPLNFAAGESIPIENSMIVIVDQHVLSPSTILTNEEYYTYTANPPTITFNKEYSTDNKIEVISSYKHDILDIVRLYTVSNFSNDMAPNTPTYYQYSNIASGLIKLNNAVINVDHIWVIKNGTLLVPNIDYRLTENHQSIQLTDISDPADKFDIIIYATNLLSHGIAYMQFKDMLNRIHFKRLNRNKQTRLAKELKIKDVIIELEDASNFDMPNAYENKPGVIEIYGERIEYFVINGNTLGKLRRSTLGTGALSVYPKGTIVQDIGPSETIPYHDSILVEKIPYNSQDITLNLINNVIGNDITYKNTTIDESSKSMLAKNSIDIFVGGYNTPSVWIQNNSYVLDDLVISGEYVYKCIKNHRSSNNFIDDYNFKNSEDINNKWQYFAGNIRLKKNSYLLHNVNKDPISPNGDIEFNADFTVNGIDNIVNLTNTLLAGTYVTVVKRTGISWDSIVNIQDEITDDRIKPIAKFINAVPGAF